MGSDFRCFWGMHSAESLGLEASLTRMHGMREEASLEERIASIMIPEFAFAMVSVALISRPRKVH